MISYRVSEETDSKDYKVYKINCACGSDDCNLTIDIDYDCDIREYILNIYGKLDLPHIYEHRFFRKILLRIKYMFKIMFGIPVQYEGCVLIDTGKHVRGLIEVLENCEKFINEKNEGNKCE